MEKMEIHHWVPISLFGIDCEANRTSLSSSCHLHIHKTLNIDNKKIRKLRCDYNHIIVPDMAFCDRVQTLQRAYFLNHGHLSPFAKKAQLEAFQRLNPYVMDLYNIKWNNYRPRDDCFDYQLNVYLHTMRRAFEDAL